MLRLAAAFCALVVTLGYALSAQHPGEKFVTQPVTRGSISSLVKATGTIEAIATVDVSSQLSGRMASVFVSSNDAVKCGQPIAQLDQEIFIARVNEAKAALRVARASAQVEQAAVERAKVAVASARTAQKMAEAQSAGAQARESETERELQRKLALARTGNVADRDLGQARTVHDMAVADLRASIEQINMKAEAIAMAQAEQHMAEANQQNAEAVVEQRQATLDQARLDFERTVLRAPIDGVIMKRDVNPGQTVAVTLEAKTLFKIANDLSKMEVHAKIDEADVGQLKVGQTAQFSVDAYPDRIFTGSVLQIRTSPEVVQNVVTYTAIISAPNPDLLLLPGMTAMLRIVVSDTGEVLKIPNEALRFHPSAPRSMFVTTPPKTAVSPAATSTTLWTIDNEGHPKATSVDIGLSDDNSTQLLRGRLSEGQPLIVGVANLQTQPGPFGIRLGF